LKKIKKLENMNKLLISLFDHSGNASLPYRENGWNIIQVDIKNGVDILTWDYISALRNYTTDSDVVPQVGIIAMVPCTAYALCGNKHKETTTRQILFKESQLLVKKTKEIIDYFDFTMNILQFWQIENPMSDIHKHNMWLGKIKMQFDPCDFAGYDPIPDNSRYNKRTWLWGRFNIPEKKRIEPITKENPGWKKLGGKSEKTKELRSITPLGFSYAFYQANS
jgi:hypothetical protein